MAKFLYLAIAYDLAILIRLWFRDRSFDALDDDVLAEREQFWRDAAIVFAVIISVLTVVCSFMPPED